MKRFACGDVVPGCGARWEAHDEAALLAAVAGHAAEAHAMGELPEPVREAVLAHVEEVV